MDPEDHENTKRLLVYIDAESLQTRGRPTRMWVHPTFEPHLRVVTLHSTDRKINKKN